MIAIVSSLTSQMFRIKYLTYPHSNLDVGKVPKLRQSRHQSHLTNLKALAEELLLAIRHYV